MRAAESSVCFRASSWQSQRVTRRSLIVSRDASERAETVFQPLPPHSGQASGAAWGGEVWGEEVLIVEMLLDETRFAETLFTDTWLTQTFSEWKRFA